MDPLEARGEAGGREGKSRDMEQAWGPGRGLEGTRSCKQPPPRKGSPGHALEAVFSESPRPLRL